MVRCRRVSSYEQQATSDQKKTFENATKVSDRRETPRATATKGRRGCWTLGRIGIDSIRRGRGAEYNRKINDDLDLDPRSLARRVRAREAAGAAHHLNTLCHHVINPGPPSFEFRSFSMGRACRSFGYEVSSIECVLSNHTNMRRRILTACRSHFAHHIHIIVIIINLDNRVDRWYVQLLCCASCLRVFFCFFAYVTARTIDVL